MSDIYIRGDANRLAVTHPKSRAASKDRTPLAWVLEAQRFPEAATNVKGRGWQPPPLSTTERRNTGMYVYPAVSLLVDQSEGTV